MVYYALGTVGYDGQHAVFVTLVGHATYILKPVFFVFFLPNSTSVALNSLRCLNISLDLAIFVSTTAIATTMTTTMTTNCFTPCVCARGKDGDDFVMLNIEIRSTHAN